MLERLKQKRAVLVAQREQLVGQVNMTNGAIAIIDETIAEHQAAEEAKALEDIKVRAAAAEQARKDAEAAKPKPEMPTVSRDEDDEEYQAIPASAKRR